MVLWINVCINTWPSPFQSHPNLNGKCNIFNENRHDMNSFVQIYELSLCIGQVSNGYEAM